MGRETKSQSGDRCYGRIDSRHLTLVRETLLPLCLFHVTSSLTCLVEWILFFVKHNLLLSLSTYTVPLGLKRLLMWLQLKTICMRFVGPGFIIHITAVIRLAQNQNQERILR